MVELEVFIDLFLVPLKDLLWFHDRRFMIVNSSLRTPVVAINFRNFPWLEHHILQRLIWTVSPVPFYQFLMIVTFTMLALNVSSLNTLITHLLKFHKNI